jgi:hypothetical protein
VQVDVRVRPLEHPVRVPGELSDAEHIACRFQGARTHLPCAVLATTSRKINDGFRSESGHGRRADMLNSQRQAPEHGPDCQHHAQTAPEFRDGPGTLGNKPR